MPKFPYNPFDSSVGFGRKFIQWTNNVVKDIGSDLKENKARVDNLIRNAPQPSEVVDLRVDEDSVEHATARDRLINDNRILTSKIGARFSNLNNYSYESVTQWLNEQERNSWEQGINIKSKRFGAKGDGISDDSSAIQNAIDYAHSIGGGFVLIPLGVYAISKTIKLKSNVRLMGQGRKSIIKSISSITLISLYDDNTYKTGISDVYLDGNEGNSKCGIYFDRPNKGSFTGDLGADNMDGWFYVRNIEISNMGVDGLYLGKNCREGRYENIQIRGCYRHGFFNEFGSDNYIYAVTSWGNKEYGFKDLGSACHWMSCKAFLNGERGRLSGWLIDSWATSYVNCEGQENYGHGYHVKGAFNSTFSACIASSNGIGGGLSASKPTDQTLSSDEVMYGFFVENSTDITISACIGEDFRRYMFGAKTQKSALKIDASSERIFAHITERNQSYTYENFSSSSTVFSGSTYRTSGAVDAKNLMGEQITSKKGMSVDRSDGGNLMTTYARNSIKRWELGESSVDGRFRLDIYDPISGTYYKTPFSADKEGKINIGGHGGSLDLDQITARTGISVDRQGADSLFTVATNGKTTWRFGHNYSDSSFHIDQHDPNNGNYLRTPVYINPDGGVKMGNTGGKIGFYGKNPISQPVVSGTTVEDTLKSMLKALSDCGIIYNNSNI